MKLLMQILDYSNVNKAYYHVTANKGSAGVDGVSTKELSNYMQENWKRIKQEIINGTYKPQTVLGVEIPKSNGGKRLLGIPTVIDRLIQQSIHQVLYPIYDIEFSEYSYGFRIGRNAHQAITHFLYYFKGIREGFAVAQAQSYINQGYQDIITHFFYLKL